MTVRSTPFGPVLVAGDDAKSFTRTMRRGQGNAAAAAAAINGRKLVASFKATGFAAVELKAAKRDK